ncbi:RelA/SpoT domain-containing protein [Vibrio fluvialis]|uniref:RelA/SpoT domain-containing protein n=1 Tax=Vibrio fluvialis TaxID=676 RepID=UPI001EEC6A41|nr:RelA/SpoT domain-containing protein [Vibrio fluvialis]MCG6398873.1 RelA/SpoT domain-containing protein [Vibrio fluvialis]
MNDKLSGVVNIKIDNAPSPEQSSKRFETDYELDFREFMEVTNEESALEDFSYSNKAVQKAGRRLRKREGDLKSATATIQTFRAAHEKPLNTIAYMIGRCCRELDISVKPVKRLKRLETIIDKLQRKSLDGTTENQTCVTNMNDIGGCRVIFPDIRSLSAVRERLVDTIQDEARVQIKDIDDYIAAPKPNDCGYRSLHIIYRYEHSSGKKFNIEAQLRTKLQHLWATTVEIVDILEQTKIKTHSHSPDSEKSEIQIKWEELLSIMSSYIAHLEGAIYLSEENKIKLSHRLKQLNQDLNADTRLESFKIISEQAYSCCEKSTKYLLLAVNEKSLKMIVSKEFNDKTEAIFVYNELEKLTQSLDDINVLLVSTKHMGQLEEAYPNYLGDCASFIAILHDAMNN